MFIEVRRRLREEEGISLVEVLVSMVLMALVLAALGSTLFASMASARHSEGMTHATALANEELERLQALHFDTLGFYTTADGYVARPQFDVGQLNTVWFPTVSPPHAAVPRPLDADPATYPSLRRGGRTFEVRRSIAWRCNAPAETTSTGCPATQPRYKQLRVEVSWGAGATRRTVAMEGKRAQASGGSASFIPGEDTEFRIVSFTVSPDPIYLQNNGRLYASGSAPGVSGQPDLGGAAFQVDLETNLAAADVRAHWGGTPVNLTPLDPDATNCAGTVTTAHCRRWRLRVMPSTTSFGEHGLRSFFATATRSGTPTCAAGATSVNCATNETSAYLIRPLVPVFQSSTLNWDTNANRFWNSTTPSENKICTVVASNTLRNINPIRFTMDGVNSDDWVRLVRTAGGTTWTYDFTEVARTATGASWELILTPEMAGVFTGTTTTFEIRWTRSADDGLYTGASGAFVMPLNIRTITGGGVNAC